MRTLILLAAVIGLSLSSGRADEKKADGGKPVEKGDGKKVARAQRIFGELKSIADGTLVLVARGDGGEKETKVTTNDRTKVTLETAEDQKFKGEDGKERTRPVRKEGKVADLKPGMRLAVTASADKVAMQIIALRGTGKDGDK